MVIDRNSDAAASARTGLRTEDQTKLDAGATGAAQWHLAMGKAAANTTKEKRKEAASRKCVGKVSAVLPVCLGLGMGRRKDFADGAYNTGIGSCIWGENLVNKIPDKIAVRHGGEDERESQIISRLITYSQRHPVSRTHCASSG